ncbi:MAG: flagellar hook-length control protein FliK [Lachnospiraceae bacterium]|nr:flagellar hook-length control protein FliK [Lachnospiraceae bacterium]
MTSAPINDFTKVMLYRTGKMAGGEQDQAQDLFGSFQNAMSQAQNGRTDITPAAGVQPIPKAADQLPVTEKREPLVEKKDDLQQKDAPKQPEETRDSQTAENTKDVEGKDLDAAKDAVEDAGKEVVDKVADKLGVTPEEVEEAMSVLGLTFMDLVNPSQMAALISQLTGEGDALTPLTDEGLFASIQELTAEVGAILEEQAEVLSEDLGVEVGEAFNLMETAATVPVAEENTGFVLEVEVEDETVTEPDVIVAEGREVTDLAEEETVSVISEEVEDSGKDESHKQNAAGNSQETAGPYVQAPTADQAFVAEPKEVELPFTSYLRPEEILDQIADYVKIHHSEGLSEMEISLNPESLGRVYLQVAAKEGVITATIAAQNETVRDALMVQALTLKEELNQQGLKVEAVEVTIESHEFERNTDNGGEQAKDLYEQQVQKQTRRRLVIENLAQAEEMLENEELSADERLQIDMMARNGGTVDFTA